MAVSPWRVLAFLRGWRGVVQTSCFQLIQFKFLSETTIRRFRLHLYVLWTILVWRFLKGIPSSHLNAKLVYCIVIDKTPVSKFRMPFLLYDVIGKKNKLFGIII